MPFALDTPVRAYAWGSPTVIPELLGLEPTGERQAELWAGAHPAAPSLAEIGGASTSLAELIAKDPDAMLGSVTTGRFGPRLPYLLKILAIDRPLSIQAHPTTEQAVAGFEAEEAAGVPLDAPERSYRDRSHKPEMIVALTEVEALLGFREPVATARLLDSFGVPALSRAAGQLRRGGASALASVVASWLQAPDASALVRPVVDAAGGMDGDLPRLITRLAADYPDDRGLLVALLLQHVRLRQGEAAFIPAGVPHAYLRGVAVEPQASSDNTLRAGLTRKHVDVDELLRILRYEPLGEARVRPVRVGPDEEVFAPPVAEFRLSRLTLGPTPVRPTGAGPQIVLVTDGAATVRAGGSAVTLRRGRAAFVPAAEEPTLEGRGTAFSVTPGSPPGG